MVWALSRLVLYTFQWSVCCILGHACKLPLNQFTLLCGEKIPVDYSDLWATGVAEQNYMSWSVWFHVRFRFRQALSGQAAVTHKVGLWACWAVTVSVTCEIWGYSLSATLRALSGQLIVSSDLFYDVGLQPLDVILQRTVLQPGQNVAAGTDRTIVLLRLRLGPCNSVPKKGSSHGGMFHEISH